MSFLGSLAGPLLGLGGSLLGSNKAAKGADQQYRLGQDQLQQADKWRQQEWGYLEPLLKAMQPGREKMAGLAGGMLSGKGQLPGFMQASGPSGALTSALSNTPNWQTPFTAQQKAGFVNQSDARINRDRASDMSTLTGGMARRGLLGASSIAPNMQLGIDRYYRGKSNDANLQLGLQEMQRGDQLRGEGRQSLMMLDGLKQAQKAQDLQSFWNMWNEGGESPFDSSPFAQQSLNAASMYGQNAANLGGQAASSMGGAMSGFGSLLSDYLNRKKMQDASKYDIGGGVPLSSLF
jgi:hypothetical protein